MGLFVKICGLKQAADVECAVKAGADAIGFVLAESPRQVSVADIDRLAELIPPHILTVGVFQEQPVAEVYELVAASRLQAVQLHGGYTPEDFAVIAGLPVRLVRATAWEGGAQVTVGGHGEEYLILDSKTAGSGETWDWGPLAAATIEGRWMLAGGLSPENVAGAVAAVRPWGVDVSSGVESSRGVKDSGRIRAFIAAARAAAG